MPSTNGTAKRFSFAYSPGAMNIHTCNITYGLAKQQAEDGGDLELEEEAFAGLGEDEVAAGRQRRDQRLHHEVLGAGGESEGGQEADEQRHDGVRQPLAQLVEVVEEAHPPVEVVLLVGRLHGAAVVVAERRLVFVLRLLEGTRATESSCRLRSATRAGRGCRRRR